MKEEGNERTNFCGKTWRRDVDVHKSIGLAPGWSDYDLIYGRGAIIMTATGGTIIEDFVEKPSCT
jgi:hypothetical protein